MEDKNDTPEWFKSDLTKLEAETYLKDPTKPVHSFIVRNGGGNLLSWLTLSIKIDNENVKHFKIYKEDDESYYFFDTLKCKSLQDLIITYAENNWEGVLTPKETENNNVLNTESLYDTPQKRIPFKSKQEVQMESKKPQLPKKIGKIPPSIRPTEDNVNYVTPMVVKRQISNTVLNDSDEDSSTVFMDGVEFYKNMNRMKTEKYLSDKETYSYLLRVSDKTGNKCLSLKTETKIQHYVIYPHGPEFYIRYEEQFPSIKALIETYSKDNWKGLLMPNCKTDEDNCEEKQELSYDYTNPCGTSPNCQNYMKTFTRSEAEDYLSKLSVFSYLVRPTKKGPLCLSIKTEKGITHFIIHKEGCSYYIYKWALFPTIADLVKTYSRNNFEDLLNAKPENATEVDSARVASAEDAKSVLATKPHYSYILSDSSRCKGCKRLSVKFPQSILHYVIYANRKGFYIYEDKVFETIDDLIEFYSENQWEKLIFIVDHGGIFRQFIFHCGLKLKKIQDKFSKKK